MADYVVSRGGRYYYYRRVPREMRKYESRKAVRISLKTSDYATACRRAMIQNDEIEKHWQELVKNPGMAASAAEKSYRDAVAIARAHGFAYKTLGELIEQATDAELVKRLAAFDKTPDRQKKEALLGGVDMPELTLSRALERFWPLAADRTAGKNAVALRKWENPRKRAVANFIRVCGDPPLAGITRKEHILAFRSYWLGRVEKEGKNADSGNKDLLHLKDVIGTVALAEDMDIDVDALFHKTSLKAKKQSRAAYTAKFVQTKLLAPGALDGLNQDAKALVWIMADTGARLSEITGLMPEDIVLRGDIPFIWIRANRVRDLKTAHSERQIPLVGTALAALKAQPQGIARYDIGDHASNTVNKFLAENGLRPTARHTLYSLRHTFKDRLRDAGAPEEVIDSLMGHQTRGPKYGRGHILETKHKWLQEIAFKAPDP